MIIPLLLTYCIHMAIIPPLQICRIFLPSKYLDQPIALSYDHHFGMDWGGSTEPSKTFLSQKNKLQGHPSTICWLSREQLPKPQRALHHHSLSLISYQPLIEVSLSHPSKRKTSTKLPFPLTHPGVNADLRYVH